MPLRAALAARSFVYAEKVCRGFIYIGCTDSPSLRKVKTGNIGEAPPITDSRKGCPYEVRCLKLRRF